MPRSIVRYLEFEIAKLEKGLKVLDADLVQGADILLQFQQPVAPVNSVEEVSPDVLASPIDDHSEPLHASSNTGDGKIPPQLPARHREVESIIAATLARDDSLVSRIKMGLTPSTTKSSAVISGRYLDAQRGCSVSPKPSTTQRQLEAELLFNLPREIIEGLAKKYANTITPQFSFMLRSEFDPHLQKVLQMYEARHAPVSDDIGVGATLRIQPSVDFLVVYLILAISTTIGSAKGGHEIRCMSLSTSLFEEGIQHLSDQLTMPSDLLALKINLLILLYATINPRAGNVWILSGVAMRTCSVSARKIGYR